MTQIVTVAEFAHIIRSDAEALENAFLLDLAEGLVIEQLGELETWPTSARTVVLAAAARAYYNPDGASGNRLDDYSVSYPAARVGVYLTEDEINRLHGQSGRATFEFPGTWPYPDPVERTADVVSG